MCFPTREEVSLMGWKNAPEYDPEATLYERARSQETTSVFATFFEDATSKLPMEQVKLKALHIGEHWLGQIAASKIGRRLKPTAITELEEGEEVATVYVELTSDSSGHIVQQGQQALIRLLRIRRADGTYEMRRLVAPVAVGVIAAIAIGSAVKRRS